MRRIRPRLALAGSILLVIVLSVSMIAAWSSGKRSPNPSLPKDPKAVTVVAGKATTLDLGGGADLIIPPGAMTPGTTVSATYRGRPDGTWTDIAPTSAPIELISQPANAIHGLLILEFPVPVNKVASGADPAQQFGISTYDPSTHEWLPFASSYDSARHMVVAEIPHFSWWNPFSWDWVGIGAQVNQSVGQVFGRRASAPTCTSGAPSWVDFLVGVSSDPAIAVRSCAQSQGDILDVQLVNNRPYGMVLQYGSPVKWGWHEEGSSAKDKFLNKLADSLMGPNQLYLPPLGHASVGIFPTSRTASAQFTIGPSAATLYVDYVDHAADYLIGAIPFAGNCAVWLASLVTDGSPGGIRDNIVTSGDCLLDSYKSEVASGALDSAKVSQLAGTLSALKKASIVGFYWDVYGTEWQLADLFVDSVLVSDNGGLGAGFSVLAHNPGPGPQPTPTPQPTPIPQSTPVPTPTPTPLPGPQHQPVDAYWNYGQANVVGYAMCRGNPGNYLSMPGGTATQTFAVPAGVATLNSAMVQVDPAPVTATLTITVNGNVEATASAAAIGDTRFAFGPIAVNAGDTVKLSITFSATAGKIITVYTVGNPGGTFTTSNTCPDGALSVTVTNSGLRAVVSGMS